MRRWLVLVLWGCAVAAYGQGVTFSVSQGATLRAELPDYPEATQHPLFADYQRFFSLPTSPVRAGALRAKGDERLFVQTYRGSGTGAWILLAHGYLESSALNARAIARFLGQGYSVAALDLPGHGLSSGEHGVVTNFDVYGDALQRVVTLVESENQVREWIPVGFSAGGASVMNWLSRYHSVQVTRGVLVAPLVHSWLWELSQWGMFAVGWALDRVPNRSARDSTSNPEFATMLDELDPFRSQTTSLTWVRALTDWARRVESLPPDPQMRILVLQGGDDTVVDGPYNRAAIARVYPRLVSEQFPPLRHTLLNEPGPEGERVYTTIATFLERTTSTPGLR